VGVTINLITSQYTRKIKWESVEYIPRECHDINSRVNHTVLKPSKFRKEIMV
jgi:hypothetical protein